MVGGRFWHTTVLPTAARLLACSLAILAQPAAVAFAQQAKQAAPVFRPKTKVIVDFGGESVGEVVEALRSGWYRVRKLGLDGKDRIISLPPEKIRAAPPGAVFGTKLDAAPKNNDTAPPAVGWSKKPPAEIDGDWIVESSESEGVSKTPEGVVNLSISQVFVVFAGTFYTDSRFNPSATPAELDLGKAGKPGKLKGIYELRDGKLRVCIAADADAPRPTKFETNATSNTLLYICRKPASLTPSTASVAKQERPLADSVNGRAELQALEGKWLIIGKEQEQREVPAGDIPSIVIRPKAVWIGDHKYQNPIVDAAASPKKLDLFSESLLERHRAIFERNGDQLKICIAERGASERPTDFTTAANVKRAIYTCRKVDPAAEPAGAGPDPSIVAQIDAWIAGVQSGGVRQFIALANKPDSPEREKLAGGGAAGKDEAANLIAFLRHAKAATPVLNAAGDAAVIDLRMTPDAHQAQDRFTVLRLIKINGRWYVNF